MGRAALSCCSFVDNSNFFLAGAGLDVDEYVRRSYKFAHADCIEVGPVACMPEPPDPRDPALQKRNR